MLKTSTGPEEVVQICEPETRRNLSDVRKNWDQLKISSTARRVERNSQFPGGKRVEITVGSHRLS
jgi:hypothetical protein